MELGTFDDSELLKVVTKLRNFTARAENFYLTVLDTNG